MCNAHGMSYLDQTEQAYQQKLDRMCKTISSQKQPCFMILCSPHRRRLQTATSFLILTWPR